MTRIKARRHKRKFAIYADGHATGSEEACAGVSALLYALAGWLKNVPDRVRVFKSHMEPGQVTLIFYGEEAARTAFEVTMIGLAQIAAKFPKSVSISINQPES